jgi:hypothetical protein
MRALRMSLPNSACSRGWGLSQKTTFSTRKEFVSGTLGRDRPGEKVFFKFADGIPLGVDGSASAPMPFFLFAAKQSAHEGAKTFIEGFDATVMKRDCTFHDKYNCEACVQHLQTGPRQLDAKGNPVLVGGMHYFVEEQGDFARLVVGAELNSYYFRSQERLHQLLEQRHYQIPGVDVDAEITLDSREFPCSWLAAITRYAGAGPTAWYYPLDRIDAIQKGTG